MSSSNAEDGIDNQTLRQNQGIMWVYIKNKIKIIRNIHWNEEITIRTRLIHATKAKVCNLTEFISSTGEVLVYSILESCLLDISTGKIIRLDRVGILPMAEDVGYDITFNSFTANEYKLVDERNVTLDLLDYSRHLNNAEYIRLIMSTIESESYLKANYSCLEVAYLQQAKENETLRIYNEIQENKIEYLIKNQKDEEVVKLHLIQ